MKLKTMQFNSFSGQEIQVLLQIVNGPGVNELTSVGKID